MLTFHRADGTQIRHSNNWVDDSDTRNYVGKAGAFLFATGGSDSLLIHRI